MKRAGNWKSELLGKRQTAMAEMDRGRSRGRGRGRGRAACPVPVVAVDTETGDRRSKSSIGVPSTMPLIGSFVWPGYIYLIGI